MPDSQPFDNIKPELAGHLDEILDISRFDHSSTIIHLLAARPRMPRDQRHLLAIFVAKCENERVDLILR